MEVIDTTTTNSWLQHQQQHQQQQRYPRASSNLSLASAATSEDNFSVASFHTCYEPLDDQPFMSNMSSSSRVPSLGCLEDVMEEDFITEGSSNDHNRNRNMNMNNHGKVTIMQPPLTAARLALSSDIGVLRRSLDNNNNTNNSAGSSCSPFYHPKKLAHVLMERDHLMTTAALPMSRCFATPRMTVGTAFRPSISACSLSSMHTATSSHNLYHLDDPTDNIVMKDYDDEDDEDDWLPPPLAMETEEEEETTKKPRMTFPLLSLAPPLNLEDMADDVQLHILSYLSLEEVRAVMATNGRYRKLMFTKDAQNLWQEWCRRYNWLQVVHNNHRDDEVLLVDDLSLPTAARPSSLAATTSTRDTMISPWHYQANLSLLLSMAQSQPTDIDREQLYQYTTWRNGSSRRRHQSRRSRRLSTTTDDDQPLLQCHFSPTYQQDVVQFTGRVGQGDRCIRSNHPFPRPIMLSSRARWILPPNNHNHHNSVSSIRGGISSSYKNYHHYGLGGTNNNNNNGGGGLYHYDHTTHYYQQHHPTTSLLDLFCRSTRAIVTPQPAWRPFVAPFLSKSGSVHLTPRFVSYFEVSILEPKPVKNDDDNNDDTNNSNGHNIERRRTGNRSDCVAVGVATESFDWHARMPGWDAHSFGYHGDDGGIFHSSGGMLRKFGPSYGRGDVVGCGIDHVARGIFFTLNGTFLGYGWTGLPLELLQQDMYPVVGIDTNDWLHCNFGTEPFQFDLKSMIVRHEDLVHQSLAAAT